MRRCSFLRLQPESMNSTASQSSSCWLEGGLGLRSEIFDGGHDACAEVGLPDAVDDGARGSGRIAGDEPTGEGEAVGRAPTGKALRNDGTPGVTARSGWQKIAALEDVSHSRIFGALGKDKLARSFGMLAP